MLGHTHVELHWAVLWTQHPRPSRCRVSDIILFMIIRDFIYIFSSPDPTITVSIASSSVAPIAGSMYSLTCTVIGAEMLTDADAMVIYLWLKNGAVVLDQTMATLSFSPVTLFDAGSYACQATVTSGLLSDPITTSISNSVDVQLTCKFY